MSTKPLLLWQCSECLQFLPHAFAPCDCPNSASDRYIVTPLGTIPAQPLAAGPLEAAPRIVVDYDPKPIPDKRFDYVAVDDSTYEPGAPIGYGATALDALADLRQQTESRS